MADDELLKDLANPSSEELKDLPIIHNSNEGIREPLEKNFAKIMDDDDDDDDDDDEIDPYGDWFQSIRSSTGLETGVHVTWPGVRPFSMSTTLDESEIAPLFHGTQWAGTRIWSAAVVALQYLLWQHSHPPSSNNNSNETDAKNFSITRHVSVLELGCGLGIPGILLHEIVQCPVVLTDKESLVEQLSTNLKTIFGGSPSNQIQAHPLDWSEEGVEALLRETGRQEQGFDVVLNCDCVYEPLYGREAWQSLIACQHALLKVNPQTIVITSLERRRADGVEHYLEALRGFALHVEQVQLPLQDVDPKVEIYVARGLRSNV